MKSSIALKLLAVLAVLGLSTPSFAQETDSAPTTHAAKKKHKKRGHKKAKKKKHARKGKKKAAQPVESENMGAGSSAPTTEPGTSGSEAPSN
jgi:hypothetical protein